MRSRSRNSGGKEIVHGHLHDLMEQSRDLRMAIPLAFLLEGDEGEIVGFRGERGLTQRLADMGFTPSTKVRVLSSNAPGPVLVDVKGSRIALGRGMAMKIIVNGM
jgi:ferrous iron transport protein A